MFRQSCGIFQSHNIDLLSSKRIYHEGNNTIGLTCAVDRVNRILYTEEPAADESALVSVDRQLYHLTVSKAVLIFRSTAILEVLLQWHAATS